ARIETPLSPNGLAKRTVALFTGARIETCPLRDAHYCSHVALFTGARIETRSEFPSCGRSRSLSSRERGSKRSPDQRRSCPLPSPSPREREPKRSNSIESYKRRSRSLHGSADRNHAALARPRNGPVALFTGARIETPRSRSVVESRQE